MKVGFICEGKTEKKIVESADFQQFLKSIPLECIPDIIDAKGNGNLLPVHLADYTQRLLDKGAEKIIILTDLDEDVCFTKTKQRINAPDNHLVIISVKSIEAWFLADSQLMTRVLNEEFKFEDPEKVDAFEEIRKLLLAHTGRGANHKSLLAAMMIGNGFSVLNAAKHPDCPSAQYLISKLTALV